MKPASHPSALRLQALLQAAGHDAAVVEFDQPTRTSAEAAQAIGCSVAEIAKSVVFRRRSDGRAVVVVACGDQRVSEKKVKALVGGPIERAEAEFVRQATGYAIGGVSPLGQPGEVILLLDGLLQRFATVWAAAGTPFSVFPLAPADLQRLTGAPWADVHQEAPAA